LLYLVAWVFLAMVVVFVPKHGGRAVETVHGNSKHVQGSLRLVFFAAFFSMVVFFTGIIALPLRFHQLHIDEAQTGYFLSFVSLVAVGAAASMPKVATRLGEHITLCAAFFLYAIAHAVFSVAETMPLLVVGAVAMGCGFGLSVPLVNHMTVDQSNSQQRGRNLAYLSMAIFSGQFVSSFMNYVPGSLQHVFQAAVCMALLVTVALMLGHKSLRHTTA
jgi:MFS family permease